MISGLSAFAVVAFGIVGLFVACILVFLGVRLVTAAYFRSKHDYELRKSHEQRKKQ